MSQRSRRSFLIGGATALAGIFGWRLMPDETKQNLFRRAFEFNEKVSQIFYSRNDSRRNFRVNLPERGLTGMEGLGGDFNAADWRLRVGGLANQDRRFDFNFGRYKSSAARRDDDRAEMYRRLEHHRNWTGARFSILLRNISRKRATETRPDIENHPENLLPYVSLLRRTQIITSAGICRAFCIRKLCLLTK
jgi:hypothetical protein